MGIGFKLCSACPLMQPDKGYKLGFWQLLIEGELVPDAMISNKAAIFQHSIDPARVTLLGPMSREAYLGAHAEVDMLLDTFPYPGGTTTCEALWMGVPVITCPGETFAGRHSLSHLSNIGMTETIARDLDEYVDLAVEWASDLPRLSAVRAGLRERMAASPLCDARRFTANLADRLVEIHRDAIDRGE